MTMTRMKTSTYIFLSILLLIGWFLSPVVPQSVGGYLFLSQFLLSLVYLKPLFLQGSAKYLFSPCILSFAYVCVNYISGPFVFYHGLTYDDLMLNTVRSISSNNLYIIYSYVFVSNAFLVVIAKSGFVRYISSRPSFEIEHKTSAHSKHKVKHSFGEYLTILVLLIFIAASRMADIELGFLGGSGDVSFTIALGFVVSLAAYMIWKGIDIKVRILVYVAVMAVVFAFSFSSKRESFFILISILMTESFAQNDRSITKIPLKKVFLVGLLGVVSVVSILASSIMRGYGNFDASNYVEAIKYIPQYAENERFVESVIGNFEGGVAYASSAIASDYFLDGKISPLLGETFARALFIPFPQSVLGYKPRKMLDIYTWLYTPEFRRDGGSYPVIVYTEFLCNFGIVAIFFMPLFFFFMERLYYKTIRQWKNDKRTASVLIKIAFFSIFLQFVRGSGLDSILIYTLLSSFAIIIASFIFSFLNCKRYNINRIA